MFGAADSTKLNVSNTLRPAKGVRVRLLIMLLEDGMEFVPLFISNDEAKEGPSTSVMYNPEWLGNVWYAVARYKGYSITLQWFNGPYEGVPDEVTIVKGDDYVLR